MGDCQTTNVDEIPDAGTIRRLVIIPLDGERAFPV